jgi:hypothetical protein
VFTLSIACSLKCAPTPAPYELLVCSLNRLYVLRMPSEKLPPCFGYVNEVTLSESLLLPALASADVPASIIIAANHRIRFIAVWFGEVAVSHMCGFKIVTQLFCVYCAGLICWLWHKKNPALANGILFYLLCGRSSILNNAVSAFQVFGCSAVTGFI